MTQAARSVSLQLSKTGGPPSNGSVGYVNDCIAGTLAANGWDVRAFSPPQAVPAGAQESMIPLALADARLRHGRAGRARLAIHDGAGLSIRTPSRQWAERHMVLHHGLAYGPGAWLGNDAIDLHVANSPYMARSLRAIFGMPDWSARTVLDPAGFARIMDIPLPVPCVAWPDGDPGFTIGADLPDVVRRAADTGVVLGHSLQPGKQDLMATVAVMFWLNDTLRRTNGGRALLVISEESLPPEHRRGIDAMLAGTGLDCASIFLPVPLLRQRALFELFRLARFGLAYNLFPEPFGFYALESVHVGCPIYTNGAGNNRFLLPAGHGIEVIETDAMAADASGRIEPAAFADVAQAIHAGLRDPASIAAACARGRARIDATWSTDAFDAGLMRAVDRALVDGADAPAFEDLRVTYAPTFRSLDSRSGQVRSDYASLRLPTEAVALVEAVLGRCTADLHPEDIDALTRHRLFETGVLALTDPPD